MPTVIECDPESPALDVEEALDISNEPFFADLERLYRRSTLLPAAVGRIVGGKVKVTQRVEYIAWARALGRRARVVLLEGSRDIAEITHQVRVIGPREAREEEQAMLSKPAWQIYRFGEALSVAQQAKFVEAVNLGITTAGRVKLFSAVEFFDENRAAEFLAFVPPYDDSSRRDLLASVLRFSQEVARVVAFNGHRFMPLTADPITLA